MKHPSTDQSHEATRWPDRMTKKDQRERAARELCRRAGDPENITFYGKPMWMAYLPEVDTVLRATSFHEEPQAEPTRRRPFPIMEAIKNLARGWRRGDS